MSRHGLMQERLTALDRLVLRQYAGDGGYDVSKTHLLCKRNGWPVTRACVNRIIRKDLAPKYIEELQRKQGIAVRAVRLRTIEEITALAFSNITDILDHTPEGGLTMRSFRDLPGQVQRTIKSVKIRKVKGEEGFDEVLEIQLHDKVRSLEHLTKVLNIQQAVTDEEKADDANVAMQLTGLTIIGPGAKDAPKQIEGESE